jgi:hypothetical protein
MTLSSRAACFMVCIAFGSAVAGSPSSQASAASKKKPVVDLGLPSFGKVPQAEGLVRATSMETEGKPATDAAEKAPEPSYQVVSVQHARSFTRTPTGSSPVGGALQSVSLRGEPPTTEKFTSMLRIRFASRSQARIEVFIVDARGDVAMSASGELGFRAAKGNELEYAIDWDPTVFRAEGDYKFQVRLAGAEMGTWPLKVVAQK